MIPWTFNVRMTRSKLEMIRTKWTVIVAESIECALVAESGKFCWLVSKFGRVCEILRVDVGKMKLMLRVESPLA